MRVWPFATLALGLMTARAFAGQPDRNACLSAKDDDQKISLCTSVLGVEKEAKWRGLEFVARATGYLSKGNYDGAIADFGERLKIDPMFAMGYAARGLAYSHKGDYDHAFADYDKALEIAPKNPMLYFSRGNVYFGKNDYDHAITDYNEARKIEPRSDRIYSELGYAYSSNGQYEAALANYNEALKLNPKNSEVYQRRGNTYGNEGEWESAIRDYDEALRLKPDNVDALMDRGNVYVAKGDYDRAMTDLNETLRLRPDYPLALSIRASALVAKKDYDRATSDVNEAIRLSPKFVIPYAQRARAHLGQGDKALALVDAEEAIRLDPSYAGGYEARGEVKEKSGDFRGALDDFEQAMALRNSLFQSRAQARAGRERVLGELAALTGASPKPAAAVDAMAAPVRAPDALPAAGRRVALVVANGAYRDAPLANPEVDADLVAASLQKTGFIVTVKKDLGLDALEQVVDDFSDSAKGADVALFYFAGHGFSIAAGGRQQNFLMATDADFHAKTGLGLERGGEPLEHVEETIIGHARATLIFVDACRDVPTLASRGVGSRGFAPFDGSAFDGAFVVISTRSGRTAADGVAGQGSPFARAFASILPTPRLRIEDAYARIREKVRAETSGEEVPDVIRSDLPEGGIVIARDVTNDH
jgi:tetratricopeptide (TPR) repeat protein